MSGVGWLLVLSFKVAHLECRNPWSTEQQMLVFIHGWISHGRIVVHNWKWSCTGVPCLTHLCRSAVGCTFPSELGPIVFQLRRCLLCKALHHALRVLRVCEISADSNSWRDLAKIFSRGSCIGSLPGAAVVITILKSVFNTYTGINVSTVGQICQQLGWVGQEQKRAKEEFVWLKSARSLGWENFPVALLNAQHLSWWFQYTLWRSNRETLPVLLVFSSWTPSLNWVSASIVALWM